MKTAWNKKDISMYVGKTYNRLTIVGEVAPFTKNKTCVEAVCDCGVTKAYILSRLISGHTKSCGCLQIESIKDRVTTHGLTKHPLYTVWALMKQRCNDPNATGYENYGGRGVMVCDKWQNDFKSFYDWCITNGWEYGLDIDKDIRGNGMLYSPENCIFVTTKTNCNKTRKNKYFVIDGITYSMSEVADKYNLRYTTVRRRIGLGWSIEEVINEPIRKFKQQVA